MFKFRAISFPILFAILGVIIFGGRVGWWTFTILSPVMLGFVVFELSRMLQNIQFKSFPIISSIIAGIATCATPIYMLTSSRNELIGVENGVTIQCYVVAYSHKIKVLFSNLAPMFILGLAIIVLIGFFIMLFINEEERKDYIAKFFGSFSIIIAVLTLYTPLILCYNIVGAKALFFLALTTKMTDTGGYIAGMLSNQFMKNGNHKIFPKLSPKKSYEGTLGGILLSMIAAFVLYKLNLSPFKLELSLIAGAIFALGSFAGDLTESAIKRSCNIKDSGNIIPGMGGFFDVLDSFIYNGVIFILIIFLTK